MNEKKLIEAVRQLGRAVELQEVGRLTYGRRENKRRIREAIEKAYWAVIDANTTAAREQQTREQERDVEPERPPCDCPREHFGPCAPAQEPVEDEWAVHREDAQKEIGYWQERAERAEREQYKALIHSETRRIRAEHERDKLWEKIELWWRTKNEYPDIHIYTDDYELYEIAKSIINKKGEK